MSDFSHHPTEKLMLDTPAYKSPLSETEHSLVGHIILAFGYLENQIDLSITQLARIEKSYIFEVLVDNRSISSKADLLIELAAEFEVDHSRRSAILALCRHVKELVPARNAIVHGTWGTLFKKIYTAAGPNEPHKFVPQPHDPGQAAAQIRKNPERPYLATSLPETLARTNSLLRQFVNINTRGQAQLPVSVLFVAGRPEKPRTK